MANIDEDSPCTIAELEAIITAPTGGFTMLPTDAYNEIIPNLYLGEESIAKSRYSLEKLGITHILNAALGKSQFHVNTNHVMYKKINVVFKGIEATDQMNFQLTPFFDESAEFIEQALSSDGKVMVHCVQGVSRSATLVIVYLMLKKRMNVKDALRLVRSRREVCPNDGFLQQMCDFDYKLRRAGHYQTDSSKVSEPTATRSDADSS